MVETKQICKYCNKNFYRGENKLNIRGYGKVHIECYRKKLLEEYTEDYVNNRIEELIKDEKEKNTIKKEKQKKSKEKRDKEKNKLKLDRDKFINYIQETYEISSFTKYMFIKLSQINSGKYIGLNEPISYEDLLYMFKSKKEYLEKVYQNNYAKGKSFDSLSRFNYDLAIILSKYESYKRWKEKQNIIKANMDLEKKKNEEEIKIDYSNIIKQNKKDNNKVEIIDILDDIY